MSYPTDINSDTYKFMREEWKLASNNVESNNSLLFKIALIQVEFLAKKYGCNDTNLFIEIQKEIDSVEYDETFLSLLEIIKENGELAMARPEDEVKLMYVAKPDKLLPEDLMKISNVLLQDIYNIISTTKCKIITSRDKINNMLKNVELDTKRKS